MKKPLGGVAGPQRPREKRHPILDPDHQPGKENKQPRGDYSPGLSVVTHRVTNVLSERSLAFLAP